MRRAFRVVHILIILLIPVWAAAQGELTAPKLTNNPSFDVIVTRTTPYLSIFNASGGAGQPAFLPGPRGHCLFRKWPSGCSSFRAPA